jgi:hypothetical protein
LGRLVSIDDGTTKRIAVGDRIGDEVATTR